MVDTLSSSARVELMRSVRSRDTAPELLVRRLLHRAGFRFTLRRRDLPGRPDVVLPRYRAVVFVHGCFWHQHPGCKKATIPETRNEWWRRKLDGNQERDARVAHELGAMGWRVSIVWECELRSPEQVQETLMHRLKGAT